MSHEAGHGHADHVIGGSPYETMQRLLARHLCGWISGHGAPVDHFLADAELIMHEAHEHGVRFHLADPHGSVNASDGFIDVRVPA
jgi:hypothetical protein